MSTDEALAYARQVTLLSQSVGVTPTHKLSYGVDPANQLEVYAPDDAQGLPVVVFLHGGGWTHGGLDWLRFMAPAVMAMPAVFVAATYRLAPEHRWPAAFEDTCALLEYVRQLARREGYDEQRIVASGHSAGGHLVALATLRARLSWLRACFPVSSRFDMHHPQPKPNSGEERIYKLVLAHPGQDAEASPLRYVEGNEVPFHIIWGGADFDRVSNSSHAMVQALRDNGSALSHQIIPGAGHFDTHLMLGNRDNPWYQRLAEALRPC